MEELYDRHSARSNSEAIGRSDIDPAVLVVGSAGCSNGVGSVFAPSSLYGSPTVGVGQFQSLTAYVAWPGADAGPDDATIVATKARWDSLSEAEKAAKKAARQAGKKARPRLKRREARN